MNKDFPKVNSIEILKQFKELIYKFRNDEWDLTPLFEYCLPPKPKFIVQCPRPTCRSTYVCIKHIDLFSKFRKRDEYRVDVWFKCVKCGFVWYHGLHLKPHEYELIMSKFSNLLKEKSSVLTWEDYGHICTADGKNWYKCNHDFEKCEEY